MPTPTVQPTSPRISGETLIRLLDPMSSVLLDGNELVAGDPGVRRASASLAE